jgi:hypothetical protein
VKGLKRPWIAALLALVLGGPGCFYLGWRRGAKATLAWLFCVLVILASYNLPESMVFFILLLHVGLVWKAYGSCQRSNAAAARTAGTAISWAASGGVATDKPGRKRLAGWKRATWLTAKWVLAVVGAIGLIFALVLTNLGLADWHYGRIQRSVRNGMTMQEVLHTVQDSGLVNGYPQRLEGDEKHAVVVLGGPHGRTYNVLDQTSRQLSESEAVTLLQQNMVPGRDYNIGFTFTPGVGPHWSMTVMLSPEGKVKGVRPFHTWD